jgi:L-aspartate oxidase
VQGANRLASNSLLEAAVFGARAGRAAAAEGEAGGETVSLAPLPDLPDEAFQALRKAMSRDAGVIRDAAGLASLQAEIAVLEAAHGPCPPLVAARLIVDAALARQESRGGHYRSDFPEKAVPARTFVTLDPVQAGLRHAAE